LIAIILALTTRNIIFSLLGGVFLASLFIEEMNIVYGIDHFFTLFYNLLQETWIIKTLLFAVLVGSIIEVLERSGAIESFVAYVQEQKQWINSDKSALLLSYFLGVVIFIESSITSLVSGAVGRVFLKKYTIPSAKLAFVCDSTSAPVSSILVFNGWGALLLGLITTQVDNGILTIDPVACLQDAVLYNYYAFFALIVTFVSIYFSIDIGAMKDAKYQNETQITSTHYTGKDATLLPMVIPLVLLVFFVFVYLFITGNGNIFKGSGSSAIFYSVITILPIMYFMYIKTDRLDTKEYILAVLVGARKLFTMALILLCAFAIGHVTQEMGTGKYLATFAHSHISATWLATIIFLVSSVIAFATGTSWGTFSIMLPIAIAMGVDMQVDIPLVVGAVISGGVFGDHCSPISDTTIISSLASGCDVIEHVKTQLPYALISAIFACCAFYIAS